MRKETQQNKTQLKSWLFIKPMVFAFWCIILGILFGVAYALIQTFLNFESMIPVYLLCALAIIIPAYRMIKKLPHDNIGQNDFVAITNGVGLISIIASFAVLSLAAFYGFTFQRRMMALYLFHPTLFTILFSLMIFASLYLVGVAVSGIYAKYKRATTLGIKPWKVILSMPFSFLLMWTPGYLIKEKEIKSGLDIKCKWYSKFNKWVLSNSGNTLFVFLFILFFKSVGTGATLAFSTLLLIVYTLWYVKHKSDFVKNIDKGYTMTAVGINVAVLLAVLTQLL